LVLRAKIFCLNVIHLKKLGKLYIPNIVLGDFDSIKPEILEYYKKAVILCITYVSYLFLSLTLV